MEKLDDVALMHVFRQCSHRLYANGKPYGQARLLVQLLEHNKITQRELISITGRRSATLSEQLDSLEKAGYITRARNEQDRRNVDVALTPLGRGAAEEAKETRSRHAHTLFSGLDEAEKTQLFQTLCKLLSAWEHLTPEDKAVQEQPGR